MEEKERAEQIALFIDIENFIGFCDQELNMPIDLNPVLKELTTIGRVTLRKSFGDISKTVWAIINYESRGNPPKDLQLGRRIDTVRKMLSRNMIQHEDIPYDNQYKNSADVRLAVEAMFTCYTYPAITTFAVVSQDRDFVPLFSKLRDLGKNVIGITASKLHTNEAYINSCDVIFFYDDLFRNHTDYFDDAPENAPETAESSAESRKSVNLASPDAAREEYVNLLITAVSSLNAQGKMTNGGNIVPLMRRMQPDLDFNRADLLNFRQLVNYAAEKDLITSRPQGSDLVVTLTNADPNRIAQISTASAEAGSIEQYRRFIETKFKCPFPPRDLREAIYRTADTIIRDSNVISLNDLSYETANGLMDDGINITEKIVFKLLYALYRAHCFAVGDNSSQYDPEILGRQIPTAIWDEKFMRNVLLLMSREIEEPVFDPKNLSVVFYETEQEKPQVVEILRQMQLDFTNSD